MINKHTTTTLILAIFMALSARPARAAAPYQAAASQAGSSSPEEYHNETGIPEGLKGPEDTFWKRDTFTGDWGGLRSSLVDKGFTLTATWQGELFGNTGGAAQGAASDGLFNLALDIDLERLTGFLKDATFHVNGLYIYGPSLSGQFVGDFSGISNIAGYNSPRLQEVWFEQGFWNKRASIRAGLLAADTEFFGSDSAALYLNGTFGAFTLIGANFPDAPVYPLANPGIRLSIAPTSKFYLMAAAFGMDSNIDPAGNDKYGTHIHIRESDGALFMVEAGYLLNQSPGDRGLNGTYKLGSFIEHGNFTTFESQAASALGTGPLSHNGTNWAIYGVADQQVYVRGGKVVSVFGRGGVSPSRFSFVSGYFDAGVNFTGFVPNRPLDVGGIAVARSSVSGQFSDSQVIQGGSPLSSETVIEATYKVYVAPWASIQPDFQYIINPSGVEGSSNAFVFGVRTSIAF